MTDLLHSTSGSAAPQQNLGKRALPRPALCFLMFLYALVPLDTFFFAHTYTEYTTYVDIAQNYKQSLLRNQGRLIRAVEPPPQPGEERLNLQILVFLGVTLLLSLGAAGMLHMRKRCAIGISVFALVLHLLQTAVIFILGLGMVYYCLFAMGIIPALIVKGLAMMFGAVAAFGACLWWLWWFARSVELRTALGRAGSLSGSGVDSHKE